MRKPERTELGETKSESATCRAFGCGRRHHAFNFTAGDRAFLTHQWTMAVFYAHTRAAQTGRRWMVHQHTGQFFKRVWYVQLVEDRREWTI